MFCLPTNDHRCDSVDENDDDRSSIVESYVDETHVESFVRDQNSDTLCCTSCDKKRRSNNFVDGSAFNDNISGTMSNFDDSEPRTVSNFDNENLSDEEDDSLSLLELQRDLTPYQLSQHRNVESASNGTSNGTPPPASDTMSTLSSVSSMTLQAGTFINDVTQAWVGTFINDVTQTLAGTFINDVTQAWVGT